MGRDFSTPGHPGVRVGNVRRKFGPKVYVYVAFSFPDKRNLTRLFFSALGFLLPCKVTSNVKLESAWEASILPSSEGEPQNKQKRGIAMQELCQGFVCAGYMRSEEIGGEGVERDLPFQPCQAILRSATTHRRPPDRELGKCEGSQLVGGTRLVVFPRFLTPCRLKNTTSHDPCPPPSRDHKSSRDFSRLLTSHNNKIPTFGRGFLPYFGQIFQIWSTFYSQSTFPQNCRILFWEVLLWKVLASFFTVLLLTAFEECPAQEIVFVLLDSP